MPDYFRNDVPSLNFETTSLPYSPVSSGTILTVTVTQLALLGMLSLEDPVLTEFTAVANDSVTISGEVHQWKNTNQLVHEDSLYYCPYAIGLKTGQTPSAGSCLLSAFEYRGTTYIIGVFGCPEAEDRFADTLQLFHNTVAQ